MKRPAKSILAGLAVTVLAFQSCKKDEQPALFTGYHYFPVNIGHAVVYDVDSIYKDDFSGVIDTVRYQVREVIESQFYDNEGRPTLRLERYRRNTSADPWVIDKVWTANRDQKSAEKKEDNITYQKLVFPVREGLSWDGNAKNDLGEKKYEITGLNVPDAAGGLSFDSTLTVLQNDEIHIYESHEVERYAAGVGMYFKEQFNGEFQQNPPNGQYKHFLLYRETIVSYTK
jgi:hypothetical protein